MRFGTLFALVFASALAFSLEDNSAVFAAYAQLEAAAARVKSAAQRASSAKVRYESAQQEQTTLKSGRKRSDELWNRVQEFDSKKDALISKKAVAIAEMRSEGVCTGCNRPRSWFTKKGIPFPHEKQSVRAATQEEIDAATSELDRAIAQAEQEAAQVRGEMNQALVDERKRDADLAARINSLGIEVANSESELAAAQREYGASKDRLSAVQKQEIWKRQTEAIRERQDAQRKLAEEQARKMEAKRLAEVEQQRKDEKVADGKMRATGTPGVYEQVFPGVRPFRAPDDSNARPAPPAPLKPVYSAPTEANDNRLAEKVRALDDSVRQSLPGAPPAPSPEIAQQEAQQRQAEVQQAQRAKLAQDFQSYQPPPVPESSRPPTTDVADLVDDSQPRLGDRVSSATGGAAKSLKDGAVAVRETIKILADKVVDQVKNGDDLNLKDAAREGIKDKVNEIRDQAVEAAESQLPDDARFRLRASKLITLDREKVLQFFRQEVGDKIDLFTDKPKDQKDDQQ